jgi:MFS family permease
LHFFRAAFAAFFKLLPVRPSGGELEGAGERIRRSLPANFAAIALNGLCFPVAGRVLGAGLLLTWFVSDLSDSAFLVGLVVPIQYGLALVAQPLVAEWLTAKPRRAPYYTAQSLVRAASWCSLGVAVWSLGKERPSLLLTIFFLVVVVDAVAAGVGNIAFGDTLARVIPRGLRGRARSWRGILGGVAAGAAGLLIRSYFSERSGPAAFGLLFAAAGALYAAGGLIFLVIDEPEVEGATKEKPRVSDLWGKAGELWRDKTFRRFVYAESLLVPITQALPFFTLFARRGFRIDVESLGLLVLVDAAAPVAGNFVWGRLADAFGNRRAAAGAALCGLLAPAVGLALYAGGNAWSPASALALFACVVFAVGVAQAGIDLATKNYMLDLAPDEAGRPLYIGFNDTLVGLPTMLLAGAGVVIDLFGFLPVFVGLAALTAAGALLTLRLPEAGGKGSRSGGE